MHLFVNPKQIFFMQSIQQICLLTEVEQICKIVYKTTLSRIDKIETKMLSESSLWLTDVSLLCWSIWLGISRCVSIGCVHFYLWGKIGCESRSKKSQIRVAFARPHIDNSLQKHCFWWRKTALLLMFFWWQIENCWFAFPSRHNQLKNLQLNCIFWF